MRQNQPIEERQPSFRSWYHISFSPNQQHLLVYDRVSLAAKPQNNDKMKRINALVHSSHDRSFIGRWQRGNITLRWISRYMPSDEQTATTINRNDSNSDVTDGTTPSTSSLVKEIERMQRKASTLTTSKSNLSNATTTNEKSSSLLKGGSLSKLLEPIGRKPSPRGPTSIPLRTESSLFDVFQVPPPPQIQVAASKRSPNAYPLEPVKQYYEILEPIILSERFCKRHTSSPISDAQAKPVLDWLKLDEPVILYDLPTFQAALNGEIQPHERLVARKNLQKELAEQHQRFCKHLGLADRQPQLAASGLYISTSMCARYGKGLPVEIIWEKMKEAGIHQQDFLQNLLYVSATFATGSARSRRKRRSKYGHLAGIASILDVLDVNETSDSHDDDADETDLIDITDEIAIFHDILYEPSEQSINVRVKLLVAQGKAKEAEMLLDEHSSGEAELRLRAYTPVLRLYVELVDLSSALRLFRKMRNIPTVHLDSDAFMHLIAGIAEKGRFRIGAEPIESAKDLGYVNTSGPGLFDELVTEMASVIYEIPESSTKRLYNALALGFPGSGLTDTAVHSLKVTDTRVKDNELFASRVRINQHQGLCPRSGVKLRLIHLSDEEKNNMVDKVLIMAREEQHRYHEKNRHWNAKDGDNHIKKFYNWLDQREGRPFTILIDGANVGYYHQNFEDGRFSFQQVLFMVDFLERLGENPLVVLPNKYSYNIFNVSHGAPGYYQGSKQVFTREEIKIRETLVRFGKIFFVPGGTLDDFYWIVASVSSQTVSRRGRDLTVLPGNPRGQWPGTRPVLVTNDQMRDHQMDLLDPFLFRRWYSNYIVNYNFAAFVDGVCTHPDIGFTPADFFSREIQSSKDQYGSTIWHFPIAEKEDEWFCCRIPSKHDLRITLKP